MSRKARRNYIKATSQLVNRKKMYKAKKQWVVAGMSFLVAMGIGVTATHVSANADAINNAHASVQRPAQNTTNIQNQAQALHQSIINKQTSMKANVPNASSSASANSDSASAKSSVSSEQVRGLSKLANNKPSQVSNINSSVASSGSIKTSSVASFSATKPVSSASAKSAVAHSSVSSVANQKSVQSSSNVQNQSSEAKSVSAPSAIASKTSNKVASSNPLASASAKQSVSSVGTKAINSSSNQVSNGVTKGLGAVRQNKPLMFDANNIQTGTYYGLNYEYNPQTEALEFTNGTLTWNGNGNNAFIGGNVSPVPGVTSSNISSIKFDDNIDTTHVTNMKNMFFNNLTLQSLDLGNKFDTSNVTNMSQMFGGDSALQSISLPNKFDTSNVTNMSYMFGGDSALQSISLPNNFDTSNVTNMSQMFGNDSNLQLISLSNKFDTSNVTNMSYMFGGDNKLNTLDIQSPNTIISSNAGLSRMYKQNADPSNTVNLAKGNNIGIFLKSPIQTGNCDGLSFKYNTQTQALEFTGGTANSDSSKFLDFIPDGANNAISIKIDSDVNTSNVTNMSGMFAFDNNLQSLSLGNNFNTSKVTNMSDMFAFDSNLQSLSLGNNFNTSKVTNMSEMFAFDNNLQSISLPNNFNTSNVTDMSWMFGNDSNLQSISLPNNFNTSNVTNMNSMFSDDNDTVIDEAIPHLNTKNVLDYNNMFGDISSLSQYTQDLIKQLHFKTTISDTYSGLNFKYNTQTQALEFTGGTASNDLIEFLDFIPDDANNAISIKIDSDVNTSNVTNMSQMFEGDSNLQSISLPNNFDTSNVTNMSGMFSGDSALQSISLPNNFDTSNVTNMSYMFQGMANLQSLSLGDKFNTSNVTNMADMFNGDSNLQSLNLNFDTSNVTNMKQMFNIDNNLQSLNLGNKFDTSNVTNMSQMFGNDSNLQSISLPKNFNTSNVTDMSWMFNNDTNLQSLNLGNHFDTSKVFNHTLADGADGEDYMFSGDDSLKRIDIGSPKTRLDKWSVTPQGAATPDEMLTTWYRLGNYTPGLYTIPTANLADGKPHVGDWGNYNNKPSKVTDTINFMANGSKVGSTSVQGYPANEATIQPSQVPSGYKLANDGTQTFAIEKGSTNVNVKALPKVMVIDKVIFTNQANHRKLSMVTVKGNRGTHQIVSLPTKLAKYYQLANDGTQSVLFDGNRHYVNVVPTQQGQVNTPFLIRYYDSNNNAYVGKTSINAMTGSTYTVNGNQVPSDYKLASDGSQTFKITKNGSHVVDIVPTNTNTTKHENIPTNGNKVEFKGIIDLHFHAGNRTVKDIQLPYDVHTNVKDSIKDLLSDTNPKVSIPADYLNKVIDGFNTTNYTYDNNVQGKQYDNIFVTPSDGADAKTNNDVFNNPTITLNFNAKQVSQEVDYVTSDGSIIPSSDVNGGSDTFQAYEGDTISPDAKDKNHQNNDGFAQVPYGYTPNASDLVNPSEAYNPSTNPIKPFQVVSDNPQFITVHPNTIKGHITLNLNYRETANNSTYKTTGPGNGTVPETVKFSSTVGSSDITIQPSDYDKLGYSDDNQPINIKMDWKLAKNGDNDNYVLPSKTFTYTTHTAGNVTVDYYDIHTDTPTASTPAPKASDKVGSDTFTASDMENQGYSWHVDDDISLAPKGMKDMPQGAVGVLVAPTGYHFVINDSYKPFNVKNYISRIRLQKGNVKLLLFMNHPMAHKVVPKQAPKANNTANATKSAVASADASIANSFKASVATSVASMDKSIATSYANSANNSIANSYKASVAKSTANANHQLASEDANKADQSIANSEKASVANSVKASNASMAKSMASSADNSIKASLGKSIANMDASKADNNIKQSLASSVKASVSAKDNSMAQSLANSANTSVANSYKNSVANSVAKGNQSLAKSAQESADKGIASSYANSIKNSVASVNASVANSYASSADDKIAKQEAKSVAESVSAMDKKLANSYATKADESIATSYKDSVAKSVASSAKVASASNHSVANSVASSADNSFNHEIAQPTNVQAKPNNVMPKQFKSAIQQIVKPIQHQLKKQSLTKVASVNEIKINHRANYKHMIVGRKHLAKHYSFRHYVRVYSNIKLGKKVHTIRARKLHVLKAFVIYGKKGKYIRFEVRVGKHNYFVSGKALKKHFIRKHLHLTKKHVMHIINQLGHDK